MKEKELYVFVEKYRPNKVDDIILPKKVKKQLKGVLKEGELTNLLFYGAAGCGKTSAAKAICEQLNREYLFINGTHCGADTAKYTFPQFASSISLENPGRKVIIIDEAEKMTSTFSQSFNSFIEEFSDNCAFILTTNHPEQLSDAIRSRFNDICFDITSKEEKKSLFLEFIERIYNILDIENIQYDKKVVAKFILEYFPDMRKALNMLQSYATDKVIDIGILSSKKEELEILLKALKGKEFRTMMDIVIQKEIDFKTISNFLLLNLDMVDNRSVAVTIKLVNDYDYKNSFVINKQVNVIAFLTDVMANVVFI